MKSDLDAKNIPYPCDTCEKQGQESCAEKKLRILERLVFRKMGRGYADIQKDWRQAKMNVEEAKQCFFSKRPVIHEGIRYEKISALIFTLDESDNLVTLAALIDKSKNSMSTARIQNIKISEE